MFENISQNFGFGEGICTVFPEHFDLPRIASIAPPPVLSSYRSDWLNDYFGKRNFEADCVLRAAPTNFDTVRWSDIYKGMCTNSERVLVKQVEKEGYVRGLIVSVPLFPGLRAIASLSFGGSNSEISALATRHDREMEAFTRESARVELGSVQRVKVNGLIS